MDDHRAGMDSDFNYFKCSVNTWSSPLSLADVAWERREGGAMSSFHGKPFMGVFLASSEEVNPV